MAGVIDKVKELQETVNTLKEEAKTEALDQIEEALVLLNSLGYRYTLNSGAMAGRQINAEAPCKVCGFKTDPPHDGRLHRNQEIKRPFTDEELAERGFRRLPD